MLHGFYIVGAFPSLCELNVQLFCCHKLCLDYRVFVLLSVLVILVLLILTKQVRVLLMCVTVCVGCLLV